MGSVPSIYAPGQAIARTPRRREPSGERSGRLGDAGKGRPPVMENDSEAVLLQVGRKAISGHETRRRAIEWQGRVHVEGRDHALDRGRVRDSGDDLVVWDQRIALKVHLRDQALGKAGAEQRKVDVGGPHELT